jgi:hypothetical protein
VPVKQRMTGRPPSRANPVALLDRYQKLAARARDEADMALADLLIALVQIADQGDPAGREASTHILLSG